MQSVKLPSISKTDKLFGLLHSLLIMVNTDVIKATKAAIRECPREIFNFYLITCVCIWSFSGVAKGFDEGMSGSFTMGNTLPYLKSYSANYIHEL